MDVLWQELHYALRALRKTPGFTAVAVLTLALGIGANTAMFSVVDSVLLRPLPYPHAENLVQIWNTYAYLPEFPQVELSPGDFQDFKDRATSFSEVAGYINIPQGFNLTGQSEPERLEARYASSGFFPLLGVQPLVGRVFSPNEDKPGATPVAIISHRLWQRHFGSDPSAAGRTLLLDGRSYILAGVLPADFRLAPSTDLWLPIGLYADDLSSHVHHEFSVLARLKLGISVPQAQAEIATLNRLEEAAFPDAHRNWGILVKPMENASAAKMRTALLMLFAAVGLVLLIACANIVNLLLARNAARRKEIALRIALGAGRARVTGHLLAESFVLSFLGGASGILLAFIGLRTLKVFAPPEMAILQETGVNLGVLTFTFAVSSFVAVLCGLAPAIQARRRDLQDVLREGGRTPGVAGGHRIRSFLVASEIALALIPLVGAGLLIRSFHRVLAVDPGFRHDHILSIQVHLPELPFDEQKKLTLEQSIDLSRKQAIQFEQIAARIAGLPTVQGVGGINVLPLGAQVRSASRFVLEGQPVDPSTPRPIAETRGISLGYLGVMGIPLREGRMLDGGDYGRPNMLINEAMARRFWPSSDPIGKRINLCSLDPQPCWVTIVGVVGNVHQYGLDASPTSDIYYSGGWTPHFVIRTAADPAALVRTAINEIHRADPNLPVTDVSTLDNLLAESLSPRRFSMSLLGLFAALALVLAAVGVYGVMSYIVNLRTNEIGIRMALGAQRRDVWRLVLSRGATLTFAGIAAGICGAVALTRLLATLLYGIKPTDPLAFGGVVLLLAAVAMVACYVPARRAVRVDPMVALRHE